MSLEVRTSDGDEIRATLVVDATGRQSRAGEWLTAIGASRPVEDQADSGFVYYTRYFRGLAPQRVAPALSPLGTISLLTLPGDNGTWSVTIFTATGDQPLKTLRHEETWTKVVRAFPLHAHWLDGEPIGACSPWQASSTAIVGSSGMESRSSRALCQSASEWSSPPLEASGLESLFSRFRREQRLDDRMRARVLHLIALQRADGSWQLSDELAAVIEWPITALLDKLMDIGDDRPESRDAWATAMALAWLDRYGNDMRDEWELIARKGNQWLARFEGGQDAYRTAAMRAIDMR